MKISLSLMNWLASSFLVTLPAHTLYAGLMREDLGYMLYRNLAENKGGFDAGAKDVAVYDSSGKLVGTIDYVPDFSPFTFSELGNSLGTLAGGQSWLIDCGHNSNFYDVDFSARAGTKGTSVQESYKIIKLVEEPLWNASYTYSPEIMPKDMSLSRLNKVVTDVAHWELATNQGFVDGSDLPDAQIWRVGAGVHLVFDAQGNPVRVSSSYKEITAGTMSYIDGTSLMTELDNGRGDSKSLEIYIKQLGKIDTIEGNNVMPNKPHNGDSGSPVIAFNEDTNSFQFIGSHIASPTALDPYTSGYGASIYSRDFYDFVIGSSEKHFDSSEQKWVFSASSDEGIVQISGRDSGVNDSIRTLKQGERGYTSTEGALASDGEMWETLDWVFQSDENTLLSFEGSFDAGAGSFQFRRGSRSSESEPTRYVLTPALESVNVNNAGYIIDEHVYVISELAGKAGDEWRIVGENARFNAAGDYETYGGVFEITGDENNLADLNLGVGITVYLNRTDGFSAANNVQINTGANVILADAHQIAGALEFGNGGGTLDLNGNDYARTSENLYTFDRDARITNSSLGTETTFSYTVTTSDPASFKASLHDADATPQASVLHAHFSSDVTGRKLELSNHIQITGDITVSKLRATFTGYQVEYADTITSQQPIMTDQWRDIAVKVRNFYVQDQAVLTLDSHAHVTAQQLSIAAESTFIGRNEASVTGNMNIAGVAEFNQGFAQGGGTITVDASGSLVITMSDPYSQVSTQVGSIVNTGQLGLAGRLALRDTIINQATLSISVDALFDLSLLSATATETGLSYQLYTGTHSADFGTLTSRNVVGDGAEDYRWTFSDVDGGLTAERITEDHWLSYSKGATLELKQHGAGFDGGKTFQNRDLIRFESTSTTLHLAEADLIAEHILVDQTQLSIVSNGYQMDVYHFILTEDSSLRVLGDALDDKVIIRQQDAGTNTSVFLDMEGGHFSNKRWLDGYTGNLELQNGSFGFSADTVDFSTMNLGSEATLILRDVQSIRSDIQGEGTLSIEDSARVTFDNIVDFKGVITSATTTILNSTTQAEVQINGQDLHINASGDYQGSITGNRSSTIHIRNEDMLVLSNLSQFSGTIKLDEGGVRFMKDWTSIQKLELSPLSTIELADGVQVIASEGNDYLYKVGYQVILGEGAHLNTQDNLEIKAITTSPTTLYNKDEALDISGKGTYSINNALLFDSGAIIVGEGATFHVKGTNNTGDSTSLCFYGYEQSYIQLHGTMIVESMLSSQNGHDFNTTGSIFVEEGAVLQLKKGGMYKTNSASSVEINVESGGTLLFGEQSDSVDYGVGDGYLSVALADGSRLGALETGEQHIYHTVQSWQKANDIHILADEGQNLHIHSELNTMDAHIQGKGSLQIHQAGHDLGITLSASRLNFMQDDISLNHLQIDGHSSIAVDQLNADVLRSEPSGHITTDTLGIAATDASLTLDRSVSSINIGGTLLESKAGDMSIATRASGEAVKMSATRFEHAHISNASIGATQGMTLESLTLTATDFTVGAGSTLVSNSIIEKGSSFTLHPETSSLLFDRVEFILDDAGDLFVSISETKNIVTIRDSSIATTIKGLDDYSSLLPGDQVNITGLGSVGELMRDATLTGIFSLDITNVDLVSIITMNDKVSFFFEDLDLSSMTALGLENFVLESDHAPDLYFNDLYLKSQDGGLLVQASPIIIPEPSTVTLGLLALTGLLARRRRKHTA